MNERTFRESLAELKSEVDDDIFGVDKKWQKL